MDFLKRSSLIRYSKQALQANADALYQLAEAEHYDAHAKSVKVRLE